MILRLLRAARGAGVRISTAEALDAFTVADAVGFADRAILRDALTLSLAKTVEEKRLFEDCFDLYFTRDAIAPPKPPTEEDESASEAGLPDADSAGGSSPLGRMLMDRDGAGLAQAMELAGEAIGASNITLFTQTNLYARRILDRMGLPALDREINRRRASGEEGDAAFAERLAQARAALAEQARAFMERQLTLFSAGATRETREMALRALRLSQMDRRDMARMRALIRDIAKRLAARHSRKRWRDRRGVLDTRRTLRRNMGVDSVPFHTVWKRTRIDKPRVMVLCDVSGSVAAVARFLLMFLYSLADVLAGIRSFAFSGHLIEVSDMLARGDVEDATAKILDAVGFGSSDYGRCLADFERIAMRDVTRHTTVIILGDARGNRNEARVDLMQAIFGRAARVIWLNPEPRTLWGTGDSDMLRYMPHCHQVTSCNTVTQLERVVDDILSLPG
ncbi:MAG TPA: VWA domain-containing protein [Acetobacteraceae bacterium]